MNEKHILMDIHPDIILLSFKAIEENLEKIKLPITGLNVPHDIDRDVENRVGLETALATAKAWISFDD